MARSTAASIPVVPVMRQMVGVESGLFPLNLPGRISYLPCGSRQNTSPEESRWYLDGVQFWQVYFNTSRNGATTWANAVDHGFFIILNVAMGGSWPGSPTSSTQSGAPMLVDYVHVYTTSGSSPPTPTPTPISGCTAGSFAQGVVNSSTTSALPWVQACSWTAGYVIVHYIRPGLSQQNVNTTYNNATSRWEYTVTGMSSGQVLQYFLPIRKADFSTILPRTHGLTCNALCFFCICSLPGFRIVPICSLRSLAVVSLEGKERTNRGQPQRLVSLFPVIYG